MLPKIVAKASETALYGIRTGAAPEHMKKVWRTYLEEEGWD